MLSQTLVPAHAHPRPLHEALVVQRADFSIIGRERERAPPVVLPRSIYILIYVTGHLTSAVTSNGTYLSLCHRQLLTNNASDNPLPREQNQFLLRFVSTYDNHATRFVKRAHLVVEPARFFYTCIYVCVRPTHYRIYRIISISP